MTLSVLPRRASRTDQTHRAAGHSAAPINVGFEKRHKIKRPMDFNPLQPARSPANLD
ncbi:MAG: hypothetical protein RIS92_238, partial [Verrucomicrobiota bacterium]